MSRLTRLVDALSRPGATTSPRVDEATRLQGAVAGAGHLAESEAAYATRLYCVLAEPELRPDSVRFMAVRERMPEAFRALQSGKLPRKAGLVVVRHGVQYDLTLQAETLAVSGAALPKPEGVSGHEAHVARIDSLRHLVETLDLLYDAYGRRRVGPDWSGELGRIRRWLHQAA